MACWEPERAQTSAARVWLKNHTATATSRGVLVFGGYDGRRNVNTLLRVSEDGRSLDPFEAAGAPPSPRNGHSAAFVPAPVDALFVLGGWLARGPLAAGDLHVLRFGGAQEDQPRWSQPVTTGTPPPACNMHSCSYVPAVHALVVVRGGDGQRYLNDVHVLDLAAMDWVRAEPSGRAPAPRANHGAAVAGGGAAVVVFGGWNGKRHLDDVHVLDVAAMRWSQPAAAELGPGPRPRAGMSVTQSGPDVIVYGGSSGRTSVFADVFALDTERWRWRELASDDAADAVARTGHAAALVDDGRRLLVLGGTAQLTALQEEPAYVDLDPRPVVEVVGGRGSGSDLRAFAESEEFSDVTFVVGGRPVHAHRVVLAAGSEHFRALLGGQFREASQRSIELGDDVDYDAFVDVLRFLYGVDERELERGPETMCLADQFLIPRLKQLCEVNLQTQITVANCDDMLAFARAANAEQLERVCMHFQRTVGSSSGADVLPPPPPPPE